MDDWIALEEGLYIVQEAFLLAGDRRAVKLDRAELEVFTGARRQKHLRGSAMVVNTLMVELLEDTEELDVVLDLGHGHAYRLAAPRIQAGKVFAPGVQSRMQFLPRAPWTRLAHDDLRELKARVRFVT